MSQDQSGTAKSPSKDGSKTKAGNSSKAHESSITGKPDTLNSEFVYYSSVLKLLAATMRNMPDKKLVLPWAKKLFRPEYHSNQFREKRNKYMLYLTLTLLNDEAYGLFKSSPPTGALPNIEELKVPSFPIAEWQEDVSWQDTVNNLAEDFVPLVCTVHCGQALCDTDHELDKVLDEEFHFFLYLMKPYASLLPNTYDRTKVAVWMQTLCSLVGPKVCSSMRGIRNDYIMALLSYVQNLRLIGPFADYPPIRQLPALIESVKISNEKCENHPFDTSGIYPDKPLTDPTAFEVNEFLEQQQVPEEGAFCYIALTGELIASSYHD